MLDGSDWGMVTNDGKTRLSYGWVQMLDDIFWTTSTIAVDALETNLRWNTKPKPKTRVECSTPTLSRAYSFRDKDRSDDV